MLRDIAQATERLRRTLLLKVGALNVDDDVDQGYVTA